VKWVGYGVDEASWEREENLRLFAQDAIDEYESRQEEERGESAACLQYTHSLSREDDGRMVLQSMLVGTGTETGPAAAGSATAGGMECAQRPAAVQASATQTVRGAGAGQRTVRGR
jgi:hypothetical protein